MISINVSLIEENETLSIALDEDDKNIPISLEEVNNLGIVSGNDHSLLKNRDLPNQHPIKAIEGLSDILSETANKSDIEIASFSDIDNIFN